MENQSYDTVRIQPYTASLMAADATFTNSYALTHPSQPNYLGLWSASLIGITSNDCPAPGSPFTTKNLGHACEAAGLTWRAYAEDLPTAGDATCSSGLYARKHCPWTNWSNLDHRNERPFTDLATDIAAGRLPNLVFVVPNDCHNTHDNGTSGCTVPDGDQWLAAHLPALIAAVGANGMVVLTWDEDDDTASNHILTVFRGGPVRPGSVSSRRFTHNTLVRVVCDALGFAPFGAAAQESSVTDVWQH